MWCCQSIGGCWGFRNQLNSFDVKCLLCWVVSISGTLIGVSGKPMISRRFLRSGATMAVDVDSFWRIPSRVFLDTCVVNMMLDHWGQLHNGEDISQDLPADRARELEAL